MFNFGMQSFESDWLTFETFSDPIELERSSDLKPNKNPSDDRAKTCPF